MKKIIKQYEDKIKSVSSSSDTSTSKDFIYKGFKYTMRAGDDVVREKEKIIRKFIEKQSKLLVNYYSIYIHPDKRARDTVVGLKDKLKEEGFSYNIDEDKEKLLKELGGSSLSEIQDIVFKAYRNGKSEKETFKNFSGNSLVELHSFVFGRGFNQFFASSKKSINEAFNMTFADIEKAKIIIENSGSQEENSKLIPFINYVFQLVHYGLAVLNSLYDIGFKAYKEAYHEARRVLKEYINSGSGPEKGKMATQAILHLS